MQCAAGFVGMTAVAEFALPQPGAKLDETLDQCVFVDMPEAEFADAG